MQITGRIHDRTFPIYIDNDILNQIPALVPELAAAKRVVIITDREVSSLYLNRLQQTLAAAAITFTVITVDGAETGKNLDTVRIICEELADSAVTTSDVLIAFGGGSLIDVAGYVAATFLSHPQLVLVPTSLFAMVDSTICPSNFLNVRSSKNSLGLKNRTTAVVIDPTLAASLSTRQIACGYAKMILFGLLQDQTLLERLESGSWDLAEMITLSLGAKQNLLQRDERLLGFGQNIGNAIEGHFRFLKYLHGEALALGILASWPHERLRHLLQTLHLPVELAGVSPEAIAQRILRAQAPGQPLTLIELEAECEPRIRLIEGQEAEAALLAKIRNLFPDRVTSLC